MTRRIPANAPIGIFDSGVGGLTVLKALRERLPFENFVYLGDTARVPYGRKPPEMVQEFAQQISHFLVSEGVKAIVLACNTASSYALPQLELELPVPIWGVIEPGVEAALEATQKHSTVGMQGTKHTVGMQGTKHTVGMQGTKHTVGMQGTKHTVGMQGTKHTVGMQGTKHTVGILGTKGTIASGAYQSRLEVQGLNVWARACPMFVPIVEENLIDSAEAKLLVKHYLSDRPELSALILGCTHYPILKPLIAEFLGTGIQLVDSSEVMSDVVARNLRKLNLFNTQQSTGTVIHYVTGDPSAYQHTASVIGGVKGELRLLEIEQLRTYSASIK